MFVAFKSGSIRLMALESSSGEFLIAGDGADEIFSTLSSDELSTDGS